MEIGKEKRVLKLEEKQFRQTEKKDYCSCPCHYKNILDLMEIPDKKILEFVDILKSKKLKRKDGTWTDEFEKLRQRFADKKPCNCKH